MGEVPGEAKATDAVRERAEGAAEVTLERAEGATEADLTAGGLEGWGRRR